MSDSFVEGGGSDVGSGFPIAFTLGEALSGRLTSSGERSASGVVPDAVMSVALQFRNGGEIVQPVTNNYWTIELPGVDRAQSATVVWRSSGGQSLRTYPLPPCGSCGEPNG